MPVVIPKPAGVTLQRYSDGHALLSIDGQTHVLKRSELCALINQINAVLPKIRGTL